MGELARPIVGFVEPGRRSSRVINTDGPLVNRVKERLAVKSEDIPAVIAKACRVVERIPDPEGVPATAVGLVLGRIQAGKTNAMVATTALAVDNGYKIAVVLTSDNTWLYGQTLKRFRQALPGLVCAGMDEWSAKRNSLRAGLERGGVVLVTTKNRKRLEQLITLLVDLGARDYPALIFDDEADQASLNTNGNSPGKQSSPINALISQLRARFLISGFVQVTATPQALLLLDAQSEFRPQFVVVLDPGTGYVGGNTYFAPDSPYLVSVALDEVAGLKRGRSRELPAGLCAALNVFLVAAGIRLLNATSSYSFLVHVSLKKADHVYLRDLIQDYLDRAASCLRRAGSMADQARIRQNLAAAYKELGETLRPLPQFDEVVQILSEFIPGTDIQVLNSENVQKEPRYESPLNILIGGAKLGRGVTLKGLLVTYYGRESKNPQMDTVQQHARMYGYRKTDLPLSRIFLPDELAAYFRWINTSDDRFREWVASRVDPRIQPVLIPSAMKATRANVLNPATVGCYIPGAAYAPSPMVFTGFTDLKLTEALDCKLHVPNRGQYLKYSVTVDDLISVLSLIHTGHAGVGHWEDGRIRAALESLKNLYNNSAYLVVFAGRNLRPTEKPNVADSDDLRKADADLPTLFMFREEGTAQGWSGVPFWIPVVRFPDGDYPVGFNFS